MCIYFYIYTLNYLNCRKLKKTLYISKCKKEIIENGITPRKI